MNEQSTELGGERGRDCDLAEVGVMVAFLVASAASLLASAAALADNFAMAENKR